MLTYYKENRVIEVDFLRWLQKSSICYILWCFFGLPLYMRYVAAFYWTTAIDLAFCDVLQRRYINRRNIRILAMLDLAITMLHKPTAINVPFYSIL